VFYLFCREEQNEAKKKLSEFERKITSAKHEGKALEQAIAKFIGTEGEEDKFEQRQKSLQRQMERIDLHIKDRVSQLKAKEMHILNLDTSIRSVEDERFELLSEKRKHQNSLDDCAKQLRQLQQSTDRIRSLYGEPTRRLLEAIVNNSRNFK